MPSSGTGRGETERQHAVFLTKAGPVPVYFNPYRQVAGERAQEAARGY